MPKPEVSGIYDNRFEQLVELFASQGPENPAGGTSFAVYLDGKPVVDVWQGNAAPEQPWQRDTTSVVFSSTKGVAALMAARLVDQGLLDLEAPVAKYWPEFAQGGKQDIRVKTLLQHRAGLSAPRRDLSYAEVLDGHSVVEALAKQEPLWQPDTAYGYHALTFGHLVGKLIHCVTGLTANEYLQKHITNPLGVEMWIGAPAEALARVAPLVSDGNFASSNPAISTDAYWVEKAMTFGGALPVDPTWEHGFNDPRTLATELAGAGGVTNARALAKIYSAAVTATGGVHLVGSEALTAACIPASFGENFWHEPAPYPCWGNGFMLPAGEDFVFPGTDGFGHNGLGGQAGWGNLRHKIGFGYTTSYLRTTPDTQSHQQALVKLLNQILEA
jgi:CubicO group peptidase (beta-lactamase class C family)